MKAFEVLDELKAYSPALHSETVDTLKAGDGEREVHRVAFCFTAAPDVLKAAHAFGADVLITHEPTYYDHFDRMGSDALTAAKKALVESTGMTVYRFHDHAHYAVPDLIHMGFLSVVKLDGEYDGERIFTFAKPMTAREVAEKIKLSMGLKHLRLIGSIDTPLSSAALCLGAAGDMNHTLLMDGRAQMIITGEITEWKSGEYVRDAAQLGMPVAMVIMSHTCAEREGMRYISKLYADKHKELEVKYFDCGELLSFLD